MIFDEPPVWYITSEGGFVASSPFMGGSISVLLAELFPSKKPNITPPIHPHA
jgi:hypothetical protein